METGDKNREVTDNILRESCMFCEESLGKIKVKDVELFRNGSVHEFCRLKALITVLWNKSILQWSQKEESLRAKLRCPRTLMTFSLPSLFSFLKILNFLRSL